MERKETWALLKIVIPLRCQHRYNMVFKYLVIEDNPREIETLDLLMKDYPEFQKTIVSCDKREGLQAVLKYKPDLIFLDVELPDFTGFDFIKLLKSQLQTLPEIIMATAHEKYAITAVNEEILYYLLKPIDPDELFMGINRFLKKKAKSQKAITIKTNKGYFFLPFDDICLIKSSSNYTYFFTKEAQQIVVSKTMKEYEPFLTDDFQRVHKSYIINTVYLRFLNTSKKKIQLFVPEWSDIEIKHSGLDAIADLFIEENNLEIPIGDAFFDNVKNSILYNKII
ncbi:MAG TPA: LytTR family DNA-binding domain-containing protein [Edaphocola sp.]|nr:LytTR family DNA-binding domain-containing protein [Edaphocola sp.]